MNQEKPHQKLSIIEDFNIQQLPGTAKKSEIFSYYS
jgi:hypothetical protein